MEPDSDSHSGAELHPDAGVDADPDLPVYRAKDILEDAARAALPRSRAYVKARNRFWTNFPSGLYTRLPTPSTNLECGFYALRLSLSAQLPSVPIPSINTLRAHFAGLTSANHTFGLHNTSNFSADQLSAALGSWGETVGLRCQMGYISDDGVPVLVNTATVTADDEGEGVVRIWVYNDGEELRGGIGHWEGIRSPPP